MSLSLQKSQPTKRQLLHKKKDLLPCPECGHITMTRVKSPCQLSDGAVIASLERFQCSACHANFFDDSAMEIIETVRMASSKAYAIR